MKKGDPLVIEYFTNLDGNSIEKELCEIAELLFGSL